MAGLRYGMHQTNECIRHRVQRKYSPQHYILYMYVKVKRRSARFVGKGPESEGWSRRGAGEPERMRANGVMHASLLAVLFCATP